MLKNVELYVNASKDKAITIANEVKKYLVSKGYTLHDNDNKDVEPDFVIGFGGDGTLFEWLRNKNYKTNAKYIGVNCGTLGFLQDFEVTDVKNFIDNIPNYSEQKLNFVELKVTENNNHYSFLALNDFYISDCNTKALRTRVKVDDNYLEDFLGSGLIFSSPTGSTARNISSVGSIIYPGIEAIQMTPSEAKINSEMRSLSKSICIPKDIPISLTPRSQDIIQISADGNIVYTGPYSQIDVYYSNSYVTKLTNKNNHFIKKIREKLI